MFFSAVTVVSAEGFGVFSLGRNLEGRMTLLCEFAKDGNLSLLQLCHN
jgi:hypothetical protein